MSSRKENKKHSELSLVLRYLFVFVVFSLIIIEVIPLLFDFTYPSHGREFINRWPMDQNSSQVESANFSGRMCASEPCDICVGSDIHLVFIGDSITRYQFLATAYRLYFRSTVPKYIVNEKVHKTWMSFL